MDSMCAYDRRVAMPPSYSLPSPLPVSSNLTSRSPHSPTSSMQHYYPSYYSPEYHLASFSQRTSPTNTSSSWYGQNYPDSARPYPLCQQGQSTINRDNDLSLPSSLPPRPTSYPFSPHSQTGYPHAM